MEEKPTRVLLVRHGMNDYVKTHRLAGWTPGVHLNDHGQAQAAAVAERLAAEPIAAVYSSPLDRTVETAEAIAERHHLPVITVEGIGETRCGEWTGQLVEELIKTDLWKLIQLAPSRARFPDGESFTEIQNRMVATLNELVAKPSAADDRRGVAQRPHQARCGVLYRAAARSVSTSGDSPGIRH